ncbi:MAG: glycosyltransferase [Deltaproteobacteria bacterium]|nr:MAG: glycosyltransferase [Deltaproteobacteria bacterium]
MHAEGRLPLLHAHRDGRPRPRLVRPGKGAAAAAPRRRRLAEPLPARLGRAAAVVLHWGAKADTLTCLRSLAASAVPPTPLVVIDNGTGALARAEVAAAARGAELLAVPENLGFAGGANLGIRHALAADADFVLLLNNDATVEPGCLGELVRTARGREGVAAVGAKVLAADDPGRLWAAYGRLTYRAALVELVGHGEPDGPRFAAVEEVDGGTPRRALLRLPRGRRLVHLGAGPGLPRAVRSAGSRPPSRRGEPRAARPREPGALPLRAQHRPLRAQARAGA